MKKLILTVTTVFVLVSVLTAQIKPVQPIKPVQQNKVINTMKLKGNVPFFSKTMSTVKYIVPVSSSNVSFRMQRGTSPSKRNESGKTSDTAPNEEGKYCTVTTVSEEKGDDKRIVLGNQNDKIYPGAIYYDNAFIDGTYNAPLDLQLKPYQITTDLYSAAFSGTSIVDVQPSLGGVNDGISELMRRSGRVKNAARTVPEVKLLSTSEQLAFEIGAQFTGFGSDLNASFSYMKSTNKNVFIARLTQVYFSVMLNRADGRTLLNNTTLPTNLVYVNKVNYGRLGYVFIASDSSREQIQAALNFTYSSGGASGGASGSTRYDKLFSSMQVNGFFFGGDAANYIPINSPNQLQSFDDFVQSGLRLDPNVAPVAVSYELKYLSDNATAATKSTTTYQERNCTPAKGLKIQFHNVAIEDVHGGDCSYAWGTVSVELWETNNARQPVKMIWSDVVWNHAGNNVNRTVVNYADIRSGATLRPEVMNVPNGIRNVTLSPQLVNDNKIMVRIKMNVNTNHKDNDIAALGFHGMNRTETVDRMLNEVFQSSETIASDAKYKYGTFMAGRFCSNTDRVHCFYALFTFTNML